MAALLDSQKKEPEVEAVKKEEEQEKEEENNRVPPMSPSLAAQGAQLTIFYNGSISVYDGITPAKAQAIMLIAAASAVSSKTESISKTTINMMTASANAAAAASGGFPSTVSAAAAAAALTRSLSRQSSSVAPATAGPPQAQMPSSPGANSICKLQAEIPHARRQSLQQFLEKRRSRLVSRAPYASVKKADEGLEAGLEGKPQPS